MPRFMGFVRMEEGVGTPPQALFDAMDAHVGERAAKGVFLDGGGLYGTEDAVNFVVRQGVISRVDGPYAEAKEVVGGWAIMQYDTLEEAVADQQEFAELHAKYWPEVTVISTLRQISTGPEEPGPTCECGDCGPPCGPYSPRNSTREDAGGVLEQLGQHREPSRSQDSVDRPVVDRQGHGQHLAGDDGRRSR